ncbi:MAG: tripartite tricarboxylate transporter substrate binding protein [Spirochaetaceae bacterium]
MSKKGLVLILSLLLIATLAFAAGPPEAEWPGPDRTISVVVPFGAGGGTDLIFRELVDEMNNYTDATIIVDNIGGAGSATGTNEVLNGPTDGYTVLASGAHTVTATLQGLTEGYNELEGIIGLNWDPFIVAVHRSKPWESFEEVVEAAQADPGALSLGNAGMGGATGVLTVGMDIYFGNIFNVTPFGGGAELIATALGGDVDVGVFSQSEIRQHSNELRPLMIVHPQRSRIPELSDIPTFIELGFDDMSVPYGSFRSLSVKAGTPEEAKTALADIATAAFESDRFQDYMDSNGLLPEYHRLEELDDYFEELEATFRPIMDAAGLLAE